LKKVSPLLWSVQLHTAFNQRQTNDSRIGGRPGIVEGRNRRRREEKEIVGCFVLREREEERQRERGVGGEREEEREGRAVILSNAPCVLLTNHQN